MAAERPDAIALRCPGGRARSGMARYDIALTYRELDRRSNAIAAGLVRHGIVRGERAVVMVRPGPEFFVLMFGVLEMGRLLFTVNALNESARRGARLAAVCNIQDPRILRRAIFNEAEQSGTSQLIGNLETSHLRLVYLNQDGAPVASPADTTGVTGYRAIRYVQLRIEG
ncbi:MAG: hypothetical protein CVV17_00770, partial [Gammaproteobacteria bacterium HGW-Gammaproteobacteria-7]